MSHIRIDKQKAIKKWGPVFENMGVVGDRIEWMSEYAEFHSIKENAYVNASNVAGMGTVVAAQPSTLAGSTLGTNYSANGGLGGSGDVGQNLLPVAMKIAAQTIGLDLVAVKPSPGPKIDLLYIDFQYDDTHMGDADERPQVFKFSSTTADTTAFQAGITAFLLANSIIQTQGGLQNGRVYMSINTTGTGNVGATLSTSLNATASKQGVVEFLGFSRIDGYPIFRAFRQFNTAQTTVTSANFTWQFDAQRNTFNPTQSMISQINAVAGITIATSSNNVSNGTVDLVSALEDHIPGFSANWNSGAAGFAGNYPMDRGQDDRTYAGVIGPKISSKTIAVGTVEVTSALRRTEIEDIKANTGMDIVQKMESILVNELSQTISKQIVAKIFEMGDLNRASAPIRTGTTTIFDLDTSYVTSGGGIGGETTHAVQRKLITKIAHASNYIATEGRIGPAQYLVTNGGLAAALQDIAGYTINPLKSKMNSQGQLYPVGTIGDISIYVDPYMKYNDNRIVIGRKNNPDQPGIIFVPYLMAQSISIISEATFAPRMLLRSRYAIAEVGWFPQKQFMTIKVTDAAQYLN